MEWFQIRDRLDKKIVTTLKRKLHPHSVPTIPSLPQWPLSKSLKKVRRFLFIEKYLISIEERQIFEEEQALYYVGLFTNLNREATSGLFSSTVVFAHATDDTYERAFSRAVGEFVERYCFLVYQDDTFIKASVTKLTQSQENFINPLKFPILPAANLDSGTDFLWSPAFNLCTEQKTLLPAQLIFWNYDFEHRHWREPLLRERNTCGLASAYSKDLALRNALYELIQRDAFFVHWFNEISPPKLDLDTKLQNKRLTDLLAWCQQKHIQVNFVEVTADIVVPSYLCILRGKYKDKPILSLGFGSDFVVENALESALIEALGLYRWTIDANGFGVEVEHFDTINQNPNWQDHFGVRERIFMWSRKDMFQHLSFLLAGENKKLSTIKKAEKQFVSVQDEIQFVLSNLKKMGAGYEPLVYFSKNSLAKNLSSFAVRVFIPNLIPMYMEEIGSVTSDHSRIKEVPKKLGFEPREEVYPYPQPFP